MRGIWNGVLKYAQHAEENPNGCFVEIFEGDSWNTLQLVDPETANDSECIGEALYEICEECGLPKLINHEGTIEAGPEKICECE